MQDDKQNFIYIHFMHGFVYKLGHRGKGTPGGIFGGHIELQIEDFVYSFRVKNLKKGVSIFPAKNRKKYNGEFVKKDLKEWQEESKNEKITSVKIPVNEKQIDFLLMTYDTFLEESPYDYALFGMRCASSLYEILAMAKVFPPLYSRGQYSRNAFVPKVFRGAVLNWAKKNNLEINRQKGGKDRFWDK